MAPNRTPPTSPHEKLDFEKVNRLIILSNFVQNNSDMYRIVKYKGADKIPCQGCVLMRSCKDYLDENGEVKPFVENIMNQSIYVDAVADARREIKYAKACKKDFPNSVVKYDTSNSTRHVIVNKSGQEVLSSNSFGGMVGSMFITCLLAFAALFVIAMIFVGIGGLFK